jgi:acetyl-CoA/propionyl-CoA carboxylase carboxyl transferase subunit
MGPRGAVNILYSDELEAADDPETRRDQLIEEYRDQFANPYTAADRGFVDDVLEPQNTRPRLISDLEMLRSKRKSQPDRKHGNIPL